MDSHPVNSTSEPDSGELAGRILVIGLGNELLTDDGVGVHAARRLREVLDPARVLVVEVGTAVLGALHLIEEAGRILAIDAMRAGGAPGSVYTFAPEDAAEEKKPISIHQLNLIGALRLLPEARRAKTIRVIGVEPRTIDYGMELTPEVRNALGLVERTAREIIDGWQA